MLSTIQCSCYDFSKSESNLLGTRNGIERNPLIPSVSELIYVVFRAYYEQLCLQQVITIQAS
jgi:hypothetical protein